MYVWEDDSVTSMAAAMDPTPTGVRIGYVYTPPEARGRGYASILVAELSQLYLDRGRSLCFLYTDMANPTSNAIYQRIGYRQVCEVVDIAFRQRAHLSLVLIRAIAGQPDRSPIAATHPRLSS